MGKKIKPKRALRPAQRQRRQPGREALMRPRPKSGEERDPRRPRLEGRVALITGGDSGIGRAVAVAFAKEGADVLISYLEEDEDAAETRALVEQEGRRAITVAGDVGNRRHCEALVRRAVKALGGLDILINNAAEQHSAEAFGRLDLDLMERTFRTNIFSMFYLTRAALEHMGEGASIVNTTSVTAYRGSAHLVDYAATKGAIVAFTRSLALALVDRGIRVNAVAPGPIWTPLIAATFPADKVKTFGSDVPMGRAGDPEEVAPAYVFLASRDASYITGQVIHVNGGEVVNG